MLSPDKIREFVQRRYPGERWPHAPEPLSGGLLNKVFRLRGSKRSIVAKYAPPHVATNPEIPLSPDRLRFEAEALALFLPGNRLHSLTREGVTPPARLDYDSTLSLLLLEDLGDGADLSGSIRQLPDETGLSLGRFIARLHFESHRDPALANDFNNQSIQSTRFTVQYHAAHRYAADTGAGSTTVRRIRDNMSALVHYLSAPGRCLTMGDLWPPSILIRRKRLHLIDWEFVHYGHPLQDCAHFEAHCRMLSYCRKDSTLSGNEDYTNVQRNFAAAYHETMGPCFNEIWDEEAMVMSALHIGAEFLIRTAGPFYESRYFKDSSPDRPPAAFIRDEAIQLLANPGSGIKSFMLSSHFT